MTALYALAGFLLAPRLAHTRIEELITQTLDKQGSVGEVRFNPFTFEVSLAGLEIRERDGAPLIGLRHLYVDAELASLWRRAVVLAEIELSGPRINFVTAGDGSVNLTTLEPPATEPTPAEPIEPTPVHIGRFTVRDGRVDVTDHTRPNTFRSSIAPIRFALTDFKTDAGYRNAYRFSGVTDSGEALEWSGGFTVTPLGSNGQFSVSNLRLTTLEDYLGDALPFRISGAAHLKGAYEFALDPLVLEIDLPMIALRELALKESDAVEAPIAAAEIDVQHVAFSYAQRTVNVQRIDVRGARVEAAREADGALSLLRLFASDAGDASSPTLPSGAGEGAEYASPPPSTAESRGAGADWSVQVGALHLDKASLIAEDRTVTPAARFTLAPATLTVEGWSTATEALLKLDSDVTINASGKLAAKGELKLEPLSAALSVNVADLPLPAVQPYLSQATAITLHTGTLSAKGDIAFDATSDGPAAMQFSGDLSVANLRTTDQHVNEDLVRWRMLTLSGVELSQRPNKLAIDRIIARQPYASVIIAEDASLNVAKALSPGGDAAPAEESSTKAPASKEPAATPISIRSVQIIDGAANFADYNIEPSFATAIMSLNGKVSGLSAEPASRAQVTLTGKVDKYAPVDIAGEVNLLAASKYTDLAINFRNMELTTFNPYSGKFAGYNISRGKLSTELKYKVEDRKLLAEHHIVLDNLEFGAKTDSKDAAPIPIKLAVALLKDRRGVIDVQLPVSGTLDDPSFRLGPIIWKAVLGLLTKIVTAPFAALGALFGGGDELAYVDFAPGDAALTPRESDKLTTLARALVERPQLRLNVPLTLSAEEDADALARAALLARAPASANGAEDESARRERFRALERAYRELVRTAPVYPGDTLVDGKPDIAAQADWLTQALLAQLRPAADQLESLARQRARAVQDALLANTQLSGERIFITTERVGVRTDAGRVRMEMKVE